MPEIGPLVAPILYALSVLPLADRTALLNGADVDQPRNLAKSVTAKSVTAKSVTIE